MRNLVVMLVAALVVMPIGATTARAATAKQQAQQQKMKDCNAQADTQGLKGSGKGKERQAFMKTCLSGGSDAAPAVAKSTQQEKMKQCNADASAKGLKGQDRQKFMSTCLSGSAAH